MSRNIMGDYVNYSKKCINKYLKLAMGQEFDQDIFNDLIKTYIDVRYYNLYNQKYKTLETNISYYMLQSTIELTKNVKEANTVKTMFSLFEFILYFDNVIECESAKELIENLNTIRIKKLKLNTPNFVDTFLTQLKEDLTRKKEFISNFETKDFELQYISTNKRYIYDTVAEYKLKFPKIYSKYAIDHAYQTKDVTEQMLFVIYPMVTIKILLDVIKGNFRRTYLVDYSILLNEKPKKTKRLYSIIDDDIVKEKLVIKLNFNDFLKYKDDFIENMRLGFQYAAIIDDKFNPTEENINLLHAFKFTIIKPSSKHYEELKDLNNILILR